jgi:hypothetical protein
VLLLDGDALPRSFIFHDWILIGPRRLRRRGVNMPRVLVQVNSLALGGSQINAVDLAAATAAYGYDSVLVGPRGSLPEGPSLFDIAQERGVRLETFERSIVPHGARDMTRVPTGLLGTMPLREAALGSDGL